MNGTCGGEGWDEKEGAQGWQWLDHGRLKSQSGASVSCAVGNGEASRHVSSGVTI